MKIPKSAFWFARKVSYIGQRIYYLQQPKSFNQSGHRLQMAYLFLSICIVLFLHLFAIAVTAKMLGVKIIEFSYGIGPKVLHINKNIIKLFPISGYVRMVDSREQHLDEHELKFAYDHKPRFIRIFISISGCVFLILFAFALIGTDAFCSLLNGFRQIVSSYFSPTKAGQEHIESVSAFISSNSFLVIIAITATKISALNLLPLPMLNGGQAILELIDVSLRKRQLLSTISLLVHLAMLASIVIAITTYIWF